MAVCHFCWNHVTLTNEHFLSREVLNVFGVERSRATTQPVRNLRNSRSEVLPPHTLDNVKAKIACGPCNSGFLKNLEVEAAKAIDQIRGGGIEKLAIEDLKKWLITRFHWNLMAFGHGRNAFVPASVEGADYDLVAANLPDYERLHRLWLGEPSALNGVRVGIGRSAPPKPSSPPSIVAGGQARIRKPKSAPDRAVGVLSLHLGGLVLSAVVSSVSCEGVSFFRGRMKSARNGRKWDSLQRFDIGTLDPKETAVDLARNARAPLLLSRPVKPGGEPSTIHIPDSHSVLGEWVNPMEREWREAGYEGIPRICIH